MLLSEWDLWPADVVLVRDSSGVSRWIRAFEVLRSGDAFASHAALAMGGGRLVESHWRVRITEASRYDASQVVVWRHRYLTHTERAMIVGAAKSQVGSLYGVLKLPLFAADAVAAALVSLWGGSWDDWFVRQFGITNFKVCSQLVAWAYERGLNGSQVRPFGVPWQQVSPDVIDDYCLAHPSDWEEVFCTLRLRGRMEAA